MNQAKRNHRIIVDHIVYDHEYFEAKVVSVAKKLKEIGISSEDRVILKLSNSTDYILSLFALIHLNISIVILEITTKGKELAKIVNEVNAQWVLTDQEEDKHVCSCPVLVVQDILRHLSNPVGSTFSWEDWSKRKDAILLFSSGSTGKPKGIVKSGPSLLQNIEETGRVMGYVESDNLLPLLPFSHFYGISILFLWWKAKCTLILCNYTSMGNVLHMLLKNRATVVDASPSTYYGLMRKCQRKPELLQAVKNSSVRMWCVGGAPLPKSLAEQFRETFGRPLLDGYGMTEVGNIALAISEKDQGCGKPLPGVKLQITGDDGQQLPCGQIGSIRLKSNGLMEGYIIDGKFKPVGILDDWWDTGDLGRLDEEGNLYVIGRKGEAITRLGYTFYPASIEKKMEEFELPIKVVTFQEDVKGIMLAMFVESEDKDISEIRRLVNATLPMYMLPDLLIKLEKFPLKRNGKVDLLQLREMAKKHLEKKRGGIIHV